MSQQLTNKQETHMKGVFPQEDQTPERKMMKEAREEQLVENNLNSLKD